MTVNTVTSQTTLDTGISDVKRTELMQIALAIEILACSPPSTIVNISQSAIDRLAQDVGAL